MGAWYGYQTVGYNTGQTKNEREKTHTHRYSFVLFTFPLHVVVVVHRPDVVHDSKLAQTGGEHLVLRDDHGPALASKNEQASNTQKQNIDLGHVLDRTICLRV